MAYTKLGFKDRAIEKPFQYEITRADGTTEIVTITKMPGEVYEDGTPLNVPTFNYLEDGIIDSRKTYRALLPPESSDNASLGFLTGDRWVKERALAVNMVPSGWTDVSNWTEDEQLPILGEWATGETDGISYVKFTANGEPIIIGMSRYLTGLALGNITPGHKYFIGGSFRPLPLDGGPNIRKTISLMTDDGTVVQSITDPIRIIGGSGDFQVYSTGEICTAPAGYSGPITLALQVYVPPLSTQEAYFEGLMVIDLTQAYGEGKEPSVAECREMFTDPELSETNRNRYFTSAGGGSARYFLCGDSNQDEALWAELPIIANPISAGLEAQIGFALNNAEGYQNRFFRFGAFVYFEISLTVMPATTAGTLKNMLAGLPTPSAPVRIPLKSTTAAGAAIAAANPFMIFDPILDPTNAVLQSITAVAVNTIVSGSGFYLAADMGNT